jgi:uncharacterized membrane protein affecting hemolysin expression
LKLKVELDFIELLMAVVVVVVVITMMIMMMWPNFQFSLLHQRLYHLTIIIKNN